MMFPSHLLASLLLGLALARRLEFKPQDWALVLVFGVLIDLDHLVQLPGYVLSHGVSGLNAAQMLHYGSAWQGIMHTPWALAPVLAAALLMRSPLPPLFWGLHMVQDFVIARHYVRFGGPAEWLIVAALAALLAATLLATRPEGLPLVEHARRTFGLPASWTLAGAPAAPDPAEAPSPP